MIEITALCKRYGSRTAVDDVTLTCSPGTVTGFLGPNGAGKTTTLRMLLGLVTPTSGSATFEGRRYADLDAWPTWAPQIRSVVADGRRLARGRSGTVHVVGGLRVPFVVTAVDPGRATWSWIARVGPVALTLHHDLAAASDGRTVAGLVIEGPALLLAAYGPFTRLPLARLLRL